MDRVIVFDTTLRDGEQSPGFSMNTMEKLEMARQLARLNVDVIEAGFPISSEEDFEATREVARQVGTLDNAPIICGLSRVGLADIDRCWEALSAGRFGPIEIIVPYAAGGGTDQTARQLATVAEETCGVNTVVTNQEGSAGAVGFQATANAAPDGSTVGVVSAELAILEHLGLAHLLLGQLRRLPQSLHDLFTRRLQIDLLAPRPSEWRSRRVECDRGPGGETPPRDLGPVQVGQETIVVIDTQRQPFHCLGLGHGEFLASENREVPV